MKKKVLQCSSISTKLATTSHLKPFISKTKEEQDIWRWKSKSQPGTGTKLWQGQTGKWDTNPPALDNQIFNDNTDSLPLKQTTQHLTNKQHGHRSCTLYILCFQSFTLNRSPILIFYSTTLSLSDLVRPVKYMARYRNIQLMC